MRFHDSLLLLLLLLDDGVPLVFAPLVDCGGADHCSADEEDETEELGAGRAGYFFCGHVSPPPVNASFPLLRFSFGSYLS